MGGQNHQIRPEFDDGDFTLLPDMLDVLVVELIREGAGNQIGSKFESQLEDRVILHCV